MAILKERYGIDNVNKEDYLETLDIIGKNRGCLLTKIEIQKKIHEIEKLKVEFEDFPLEDINDYLVLKAEVKPTSEIIRTKSGKSIKNQFIDNHYKICFYIIEDRNWNSNCSLY